MINNFRCDSNFVLLFLRKYGFDAFPLLHTFIVSYFNFFSKDDLRDFLNVFISILQNVSADAFDSFRFSLELSFFEDFKLYELDADFLDADFSIDDLIAFVDGLAVEPSFRAFAFYLRFPILLISDAFRDFSSESYRFLLVPVRDSLVSLFKARISLVRDSYVRFNVLSLDNAFPVKDFSSVDFGV